VAEINDYVLAVYWRDMFAAGAYPDAFVRKEDIVAIIRSNLTSGLSNLQADEVTDLDELSETIFGRMLEAAALETRTDRFAGTYYKPNVTAIKAYRSTYLSENPIHATASEVGSAFYADVFAGFRGQNPLNDPELQGMVIPASDRIVTLGHNQIQQFEAPLDDLVTQLERDNGLPDEPGTKERLLGQVKAGRELLRAGTFKAYLLYATLIRALGELIERYKGTAIAMVAASLVDLLVKHALGAN
jgi:hypothetical protein